MRWLDGQLRDGAGPRMQGLFPEGDHFTSVLTGLAAARVALATSGSAREAGLLAARQALTGLDAPRNTELFTGMSSPPGGVFFRGWRLLLLTEIARAAPEGPELAEVRTEAAQLQQAFATSSTGLLESYPGKYWPCDNVVAMAGSFARTPFWALMAHVPLEGHGWPGRARSATGRPACCPTAPARMAAPTRARGAARRH